MVVLLATDQNFKMMMHRVESFEMRGRAGIELYPLLRDGEGTVR